MSLYRNIGCPRAVQYRSDGVGVDETPVSNRILEKLWAKYMVTFYFLKCCSKVLIIYGFDIQSTYWNRESDIRAEQRGYIMKVYSETGKMVESPET